MRGEIEVSVEEHSGAIADRICIVIRSGDGCGVPSIRARVCYGDAVIAECVLAGANAVFRCARIHHGAHLEPRRFSMSYDIEGGETKISARASVRVSARPATPAEKIAADLFPAITSTAELSPSLPELFCLKRVFSR